MEIINWDRYTLGICFGLSMLSWWKSCHLCLWSFVKCL